MYLSLNALKSIVFKGEKFTAICPRGHTPRNGISEFLQ